MHASAPLNLLLLVAAHAGHQFSASAPHCSPGLCLIGLCCQLVSQLVWPLGVKHCTGLLCRNEMRREEKPGCVLMLCVHLCRLVATLSHTQRPNINHFFLFLFILKKPELCVCVCHLTVWPRQSWRLPPLAVSCCNQRVINMRH